MLSWRWVSSLSIAMTLPGHEAQHLVHDLGSDRATGPGDQHGLAVEDGLHCFEIGGDRRTEQEVLDLQVPDVGTAVVSGEQLVEIGDDPQPHVDVDAEVDQAAGEDTGALRGDDYLLDVQRRHQRCDVLQLADDRKVGETPSLRSRPGADEPDNIDLVGAGVAGQIGGALAGAEDENTVTGVESETPVEREETGPEADRSEEAERDHRSRGRTQTEEPRRSPVPSISSKSPRPRTMRIRTADAQKVAAMTRRASLMLANSQTWP